MLHKFCVINTLNVILYCWLFLANSVIFQSGVFYGCSMDVVPSTSVGNSSTSKVLFEEPWARGECHRNPTNCSQQLSLWQACSCDLCESQHSSLFTSAWVGLELPLCATSSYRAPTPASCVMPCDTSLLHIMFWRLYRKHFIEGPSSGTPSNCQLYFIRGNGNALSIQPTLEIVSNQQI